MTYGNLPPGQKITNQFPILDLGENPSFNPGTWDFIIEGEVTNTMRTGWAELLKFPTVTQRSDFHCVTGWSRLNDEWEGIQVRALLEFAGPMAEAKYALAFAEGKYTTSLLLSDLLEEDVLLALKFNGNPLEPIHGGPIRLLVPKKYAYKSAKWVRGIKLYKEPVLGYWESRGYSNSADPWKEERYG